MLYVDYSRLASLASSLIDYSDRSIEYSVEHEIIQKSYYLVFLLYHVPFTSAPDPFSC